MIGLNLLADGIREITVQRTAADPFERVHDQANGAHVWFEGSSGVLEPIATMSGVESATGMFLQVRGTLVGSLSPVGLKFWPAGPEVGQIGPALLREGRWPEVGSNGVVIDIDLARRIGAGIGDTIDVSSASTATQLEVVGIGALTADSPGAEPVPVFVSPETVLLLAGGSIEGASQDDLFWRQVNHAIGVRLDDPAAAETFKTQVEDEAVAAWPQPVAGLSWITVADDIGRQTEGAVLMFSVFSVFAIAVAAFVIANAVGASVLLRPATGATLLEEKITLFRVTAFCKLTMVGL